MDLKLKDEQIFSGLLLLAVQNNIMLRTMNKALIEYISERDGDDRADKFEKIINDLSVETQSEVLAHLKSTFGDVDDINLDDLLSKK